jgi:hypothetical protein
VLCRLSVIIVDEIYPKRHFFLYPTDVPLSASRERGMWSAEAELRLTLKLRFSTPNRSACGTPLSHSVGEGLGVRGNKRALRKNSEPKRCTLISSIRFPLRGGN